MVEIYRLGGRDNDKKIVEMFYVLRLGIKLSAVISVCGVSLKYFLLHG